MEPEQTNLDDGKDNAGAPPATPEVDPTLERLRSALAATIPGLDAAAITGASLAEVEASYASARTAYEAGIAAARQEAAVTVPAGAPSRGGQSVASPRDKIRRGLRSLERSA